MFSLIGKDIRRKVRGFSLLETIIGALIFSVITGAALAVWTNYQHQVEKSQRDAVALAFCELRLETTMALGYAYADPTAPAVRVPYKIDSSWTDVTTGETKPIEPTTDFEMEQIVTEPQIGLRHVLVNVYYQSSKGEKKISLETMLYRSN